MVVGGIQKSGMQQLVAFLNNKGIDDKSSDIQKDNPSIQFFEDVTAEEISLMQSIIVEKVIDDKDSVDSSLSNELFMEIFFPSLMYINLDGVSISTSITDDKSQLILARFAMRFMQTKQEKIDEAVAILNKNLELKEAVKMVLAELDNQEAIERFNQIFNPQTVDNPKEAPTSSTKPSNKTYTPTGTDEANYTAVTTPFINKTKVAGREILQYAKNAEEPHTIAVRGMNMNPDNIDDQIKYRQEFQKARYMAQLSNQKRAEFVLQLMKILSAYNLTEQDREGLSEFIEQIDRHGLRVYFFASRLRSVVTINFETNEISVNKKNPEYIKALDKIMLNRKGVSFEKADEWLSGAIIKAIVIKQLLDMDKELENTAQQMDEIIVDVENKIQIINQRIETLKLREDYIKAKEIVKKFFEGIKLNITDFFRSYSEKAAKLMIESMLFCTRQDRANLINIRRILDKNLALLMKEFKKDFVIKSNNKQIERAIDVVITVYQKDNQKDMDNFG